MFHIRKAIGYFLILGGYAVLFLRRQDLQKLIVLPELIESIEKAFMIYEAGDFEMPDRIHIHRHEDTLLYMPCFSDSIFGTKIITVFPDNPQKGAEPIQGIMLLNDVATAKPLAIIDGAALTAYRTGAVGGVGVKYTTPVSSQSVGLVGAGVQGYYQLLMAAQVRNLKQVNIFDPYSKSLPEFCKRVREAIPGVMVMVSPTVESMIKNSEIIITTTNAGEPVLPNDQDLLRGKHIIAVGSYKPHMRELPEAVSRLVEIVYVDTEFGVKESGDLCIPLENGWIRPEQIKTFGKLVNGELKVHGQTTLFKTVGMALFDLVVGEHIYRRACKLGIGQDIEF